MLIFLGLAGLPASASGAAGGTTLYMPLVVGSAAGGSSGGNPNCIPAQSVPDPLYLSNQANMRQIHANDAWANCEEGSPDVVVAVVDSGVDLTHPDLVANLTQGYNFVEGNTTPTDDTGHGSHVAGIIGASLNGIGVVGVAPQVKLLPVRVMSGGTGMTSVIAQGIRWAAERAEVINLSLGGTDSSEVLQDAINYAIHTKGRIVVAAAGNEGDHGNLAEYPAAYPGVLAVAAVDGSNQHASFSNSGSYISFSAPGVRITSTVPSGQYATFSGTSMAAPHVSGLAALIWSAHPKYTADQVIAAMQAGAVDLGDPGWDPLYGYGLIDAYPPSSLAAVPPAAPLRAQSLPAPAAEDRSTPIAPGRVLVKLKPGATPFRVGALGVSIAQSGDLAGLGVQVYQVAPGEEWAAVDALRAQAGVEYAEPDFLASTVQ